MFYPGALVVQEKCHTEMETEIEGGMIGIENAGTGKSVLNHSDFFNPMR